MEIPSVARKFSPDFYRNLRSKYPQAPKTMQINVRRALKRPLLQPKPVAFYMYNIFDHLVSFDADGTQIEERKGDGMVRQCVVLSNGCVVTTLDGAIFKNIVLETYNPATGDKQTVSLPQEEQTTETYTLLEFPKNHVCVYRKSSVFVFDPLNPFTTFARRAVCSHDYQQFNGALYLWCNVAKTWTILSNSKLDIAKVVKADISFDAKCTPRWVSPSSFVCMIDASPVKPYGGTVGLFNIDTNTFAPFNLKPYVNDSVGQLVHYVDRHYVMIVQWPGWAEQSTDVRMTVFCTKTNETLFSQTMLNNRTTGLAAMNDFVGGFKWPYVQLKFSELLNVQVYNLDTRLIEFNYPVSIMTVKEPIATVFMGELAIMSIKQEVVVRHFKQIKTKSLMFGRLFYPNFQDETIPIAPPITVVTPQETLPYRLTVIVDPPTDAPAEIVKPVEADVAKDIVVDTPKSETPVVKVVEVESKPTEVKTAPVTVAIDTKPAEGGCSIM